MSDNIWLNRPTGPNENQSRAQVEQADRESLQTELREQLRISSEQVGPFDHNRVGLERKPN